jgi:hypothetical protein
MITFPFVPYPVTGVAPAGSASIPMMQSARIVPFRRVFEFMVLLLFGAVVSTHPDPSIIPDPYILAK